MGVFFPSLSSQAEVKLAPEKEPVPVKSKVWQKTELLIAFFNMQKKFREEKNNNLGNRMKVLG